MELSDWLGVTANIPTLLADGRHIGNWKFAISLHPFNRLQRNFKRICRLLPQAMGSLKFTYFKNSRWRTAAILEIENSLYLCNRSTDHNEILHEHADWGRKQWGSLKFAYFKNSIWRTAAILEIENSLYLCSRSSDHDEFCMSIQIGAANNAES